HASGHAAAMKTLHSGRIDSNLSKHTFEGNEMGLGPPILALYRQLELLGTFEDIDSVVELGSQGVWCPDRRLLLGLFEAFGRPTPSGDELDVYINSTGTGLAASRHLHEKLGFKYDCVDIDGNFGSLTLDINFDAVPPQARGKYGLTTNHGTTEHVLDQRNAFKMIHDFTAPGGLMLHALPFTVHLEHGFLQLSAESVRRIGPVQLLPDARNLGRTRLVAVEPSALGTAASGFSHSQRQDHPPPGGAAKE